MNEVLFTALHQPSMINTDWTFLNELCTAGKRQGRRWIALNVDKIGTQIPMDAGSYDDYV